MDVNFDGKMDIVSSGWMFLKGAFWYENPGKKDVVWKSTRIHQAVNMEGVIHGDIDGDGDDDILCNHWALVKGQGMTWLEHINKAPWFVEHVVGTEGDIHGNGLGDINGDGRVDIVTPVGWYEQPKRATDTPWTFHADYEFAAGQGQRRGGLAPDPGLRRGWRRPQRHHHRLGPRLWSGLAPAEGGRRRQTDLHDALGRDRLQPDSHAWPWAISTATASPTS